MHVCFAFTFVCTADGEANDKVASLATSCSSSIPFFVPVDKPFHAGVAVVVVVAVAGGVFLNDPRLESGECTVVLGLLGGPEGVNVGFVVLVGMILVVVVVVIVVPMDGEGEDNADTSTSASS